ALESGRTSWTAVLDAVRLGPTDDATAVTADQLRALVGRLTTAGHWCDGDPDILIVADAGYDITRLAFVLADLPVELHGADPLRPGPTATDTTPSARLHRAPTQARTRVRPGQARHLARTGAHHDRGFRNLRATTTLPASAPIPTRPGPGTPTRL